ncbi:hypothetical protein ACFL09_07060 [Planctomycetota bacterium]
MKRWLLAGVAGALLAVPCCARLSVEPIEIKPIHITMDINIKIQKQLDADLAFEDEFEAVEEKKK